jgi:single-strand DNA-binding protein
MLQLCINHLRKHNLKLNNMNTLRNSVRLVGNLGMDPEVKNFDNNRKLARLSIATNESYKNDKGEKVTETQWHNLILWGNQAKLAGDYLKKGDEVAIEGKLTNRNYVDKDGNKRYACEVVVNEFIKLK